VGVVRPVASTQTLYEALGRLFFAGGIVLGVFLGARILRELVDTQIARQSSYLTIPSTPVFELPPATPLPTLTPTPVPTATPPPLPPIRISIPAISLNSNIKEISPTEKIFSSGESVFAWEPLPNSVAHYDSSSNPGGGGNIVLNGHNNTLGEVFRYLNLLNPGDEVILYTEIDEFHYQVQQKVIFPYVGAEAEGDLLLQVYAAPQSTEIVTIISCWPYATNASRIIIIAVPIPKGAISGG